MVSYKTNKQTEVHFADINSALLFKRAQRCIGLYCVTSTRINQYLFNHKWWMSLLSLLPAQTTSGTISHPSYLEPRFRFFFCFFFKEFYLEKNLCWVPQNHLNLNTSCFLLTWTTFFVSPLCVQVPISFHPCRLDLTEPDLPLEVIQQSMMPLAHWEFRAY